MYFRLIKIVFFCISLVWVLPAGSEEISPSDYRFGRGDAISVSIFGEPDLSVQNFFITREGMVVLPLVGKVLLVGKTLREAEQAIEEAFKDGYLKDPKVSILINAYRPFFVNGQVKKPGSYEYVIGITARQAIAIAGGLTDRASLRKISVVREGGEEAKDVSDALDITQINPGDVVSVGESLF